MAPVGCCIFRRSDAFRWKQAPTDWGYGARALATSLPHTGVSLRSYIILRPRATLHGSCDHQCAELNAERNAGRFLARLGEMRSYLILM
jgi:hypothetical protein